MSKSRLATQHPTTREGVPPCIAVLGPTCSGKTAVAISLAERLNAHIVSCDSMQVYKRMDAGTAKPSPDLQQRVPHHMIDIVDIHAPFDTNMYVQRAAPILEELGQHGGSAVLAGGTGLYARALIYGLELLPADRELFSSIEQEYAQPGGPERLLAELRRAATNALQPALLQNPRRLLRAVEVLRLSGRLPRAAQTATPDRQRAPSPAFRQFVLMPPDPQTHREWIAARTRGMLDGGWIEETEQLVADGLLTTPTARQALGYNLIAAFLRGDLDSLPELADLIATRTAQYAKRQRTWFRNQHPEALQITVTQSSDPAGVACEILTSCRTG